MKVGFLTRSLSRDAGGIFEIETAFARELTHLGCTVSPFGLLDSHTEDDKNSWGESTPVCFRHHGNDSYRYSPELRKAFKKQQFDICHLHSLWSYTSVVANAWSMNGTRPLVISPNGMLDPWALRNSAWKKRIVFFLTEKKLLRNAACLHANTDKEANDFRAFGLTNPIAVIPNGVYIPNRSSLDHKTELSRNRNKKLLYIGRIHPKKGLANAVIAWSQRSQELRASGWQFVIAGWDQNGHLAELQKICANSGLRYTIDFDFGKRTTEDWDICFCGPTYGEEKQQLLLEADTFILPSFSEGMPMAVLEAWAYCLPVLKTNECNLQIGFKNEAAFRIDTSIEGITSGLRFLLETSDKERKTMGENGRRLAELRFSWTRAAEKMKDLYCWLAADGARPDELHK